MTNPVCRENQNAAVFRDPVEFTKPGCLHLLGKRDHHGDRIHKVKFIRWQIHGRHRLADDEPDIVKCASTPIDRFFIDVTPDNVHLARNFHECENAPTSTPKIKHIQFAVESRKVGPYGFQNISADGLTNTLEATDPNNTVNALA